MSRCELCRTKLNSHNPGPRCHAHTPGEIIYEVVPKFACSPGTEPGASEFNRASGYRDLGVFLRPGDEGYNKIAYSRHAIGQIQEDGTLRRYEGGDRG